MRSDRNPAARRGRRWAWALLLASAWPAAAQGLSTQPVHLEHTFFSRRASWMTLHTTTAPSTVDRIIDQFPSDRQQQVRVMLAESLRGVIAQTLLPKKGGGRIAAFEILIITPAISNLIREGKTFQIASTMQTGKSKGMVMLNDSLIDLVKQDLVEPRDAYLKAFDKAGFESLLKANDLEM